MTTAAQNIHVFLRKSPLCRSHFFEWLKTVISSNACGTSTLKSPLLRAFFTPHVHPRPRKRPPRCTLDCGFQTSESPALRGFVGGLRALATAALYLVLKSNGLHRPENLPVKFGFSPKTIPANIAKKLPSRRCPQPFLIPIFNFPHKRPTFAFTDENGYTLGSRRKIAHKGLHGETRAFLPSATAWLCAASEIHFIPPCFYIHTFPGSMWTTTISNSSISDHLSSRFSASRTNGPRSLSRVKAGTHSALGEKSHTTAHAETGGVSDGGGITTLGAFRTFTNIPGPGIRTASFAAFGAWSGVLPKNAESLRNSDALMRVAVPRRRGPAGLRDPVAIVSMIKNMINPWAGSFLIFCWANANSIKKVVLQPF